MRKWQIGAIGGVVLAAVAGGMIMTNPDEASYEAFATEALINYAGENLCPKVPFLGRMQCESLLKTNQAEIKKIVARGTQRHNFIFFSIYTTELSVTSLLPSYEFGTVGAFNQFYVYKAKQI